MTPRKPKTLTRAEIEHALRIGSAEYAANREYERGRYDPEKGGPALARLNELRRADRQPKARKVEARVEAWVCVGPDGYLFHCPSKESAEENARDRSRRVPGSWRAVLLIEAPDPKLARLDAAVLRAADKFYAHPDDEGFRFRLDAAIAARRAYIERRQKAGKR